MVEAESVHSGCVATCHGDENTWYEVWTENWGEGIDQKANAHLIAAAPELYEALSDALEKYGYRDMDATDYDRYAAILAKARGESQ
tara:strand:- start:947 stop:1204 length:258 start_codon:yes stop_codon:yes gene_type:complete